MFENWVLRRIFGPKRDEIRMEQRGVHKEELYVLYSLLNIIRVIKLRRQRLVGHIASRRSAYRVSTGRPEGKSLLGRPRHRWEDI